MALAPARIASAAALACSAGETGSRGFSSRHLAPLIAAFSSMSVPLFGSGRRGAIDMPVVDHQIEWLQFRIRRIPAMHGLAAVADDHVLHDSPDDVVEDRHTEQREAVGPGNEDRSDDDQGDPGSAVEVLLEVELVVTASDAG